jgi:polysaccharide export outer membrane protein
MNKVCLAAAVACSAYAQSGLLMNGNFVRSGVTVNYETKLEPPTPSFAGGFAGGSVADDLAIHRYLTYNPEHKFFGYDLHFQREMPTNTYRAIFRPLSIAPARLGLGLKEPNSWAVVELPTLPSPQTIHPGDTIALDLFVNPSTGQKIVEYLHFPKSDGAAHAYQIQANDVLYIRVPHNPDLNEGVTVRPDGFITLRQAGQVKAVGLTTAQLGEAIGERLPTRYSNPTLDVQVVRMNGPKYYVAGQIHKPGAYILTTPKTVLEAITEAGGPADFAKTKGIYILRHNEKLPFNYNDVVKGRNLEQNILIQDGDVIQIP